MSYKLTLYLILIILFLVIFIFRKDTPFLYKGVTYNHFFGIVCVIILIIIVFFFTFSLLAAILLFGLIIFIYRINDRLYIRRNLHTIEEFPIYIEPIEIKTNCNPNNDDGCKIRDDYPCYICDGGIHNRHW